MQGVMVEDSLGTSAVSGVQVLFASLPSLSQEISLVTAFNPGLPSVLFVCSLNYSEALCALVLQCLCASLSSFS